MALAVFRCDASAPLGSGHVRRCLTLADALAEVGHKRLAAPPGRVGHGRIARQHHADGRLLGGGLGLREG